MKFLCWLFLYKKNSSERFKNYYFFLISTKVSIDPSGREEVPVQISRLVDAHEIIFKYVRKAAKQASEGEDEGTNDLLVSNIIRTNELQTWFVSEHLVAMSPIAADSSDFDGSFSKVSSSTKTETKPRH